MSISKHITEDIYHQMENKPFVFYEYVEEEYDNSVYDYWLSRNKYIKGKCKGDFFESYEIEVALAIIDIPGKKNQEGEYEVKLRPISTKSVKDISTLFNCYIFQRNNNKLSLDRDTSYRELIWFLYNCDWSSYLMVKALDILKEDDRNTIFHLFSQIGFCLSPQKQSEIENISYQYGYEYKKFMPQYLKDAYYALIPSSLFPKATFEKCSWGLYDIVKALNGDNWFWSNYEMSFFNIGTNPPISYDINRLKGIDSPLVNIARWLNKTDTLQNYDILEWAFWFYSYEDQLKILNDYFEETKKNISIFNSTLLRKIHDNKCFNMSIIYQYIFEPFEDNTNDIRKILSKIINLPFMNVEKPEAICIEQVEMMHKVILQEIENKKHDE